MKSTEYAIGSIVEVSGHFFIKRSNPESQEDGVSQREIWVREDQRFYTPTLPFSMGITQPAFNSLMT